MEMEVNVRQRRSKSTEQAIKSRTKGVHMDEKNVDLIKAYREYVTKVLSDETASKGKASLKELEALTKAVELALDYRWLDYNSNESCKALLCPKNAAKMELDKKEVEIWDRCDRGDISEDEEHDEIRFLRNQFYSRWGY